MSEIPVTSTITKLTKTSNFLIVIIYFNPFLIRSLKEKVKCLEVEWGSVKLSEIVIIPAIERCHCGVEKLRKSSQGLKANC